MASCGAAATSGSAGVAAGFSSGVAGTGTAATAAVLSTAPWRIHSAINSIVSLGSGSAALGHPLRTIRRQRDPLVQLAFLRLAGHQQFRISLQLLLNGRDGVEPHLALGLGLAVTLGTVLEEDRLNLLLKVDLVVGAALAQAVPRTNAASNAKTRWIMSAT